MGVRGADPLLWGKAGVGVGLLQGKVGSCRGDEARLVGGKAPLRGRDRGAGDALPWEGALLRGQSLF